MQKRSKVVFIIIFIASIIGGIIGFAMGKSGVGKIKVATDIEVFDIFMLSLLTICVIASIYDVYKIYKSKKQFGITKFIVMSSKRKRSRNLLIFLILDTLLIFIISLISRDYKTLPLGFICLIMTVISGLHGLVKNGIGENGVMYCGVYYNWKDIKYGKVENETLIEMIVANKLFGKKYDNIIKFNFDPKEKDNINSFFLEKINT